MIVTGIVLFFLLLIYNFLSNSYDTVKTETVISVEAQKTINTKIFAVRDEKYMSNGTAGIVVPLVGDGEKLAKGDEYAVVCSDTENAASYIKKQQIKDDIVRYEQLNNKQSLNAIDIDKIDKEIDLTFSNLLDTVYSGDYSKLQKSAGEFRNKLTSRQNAVTPQQIDYNNQINILKEELLQMEASGLSAQGFVSEYSGYYSSNTDGFENSISYEKIDSVTPAEIENAISGAGYTQPPASFGKIICSFNWYLLAVVNNSETTELKIGNKKEIQIGRNGEIVFEATVYAVNPSDSGKTSVVFTCNQMNGQYAQIRIEDAKIVLSGYTGYKVNSSAIRTVDGLQGVYVLKGNVVGFRQVNIAESRDNYIIAKKITNNADAKIPYNIELFDEVIVEGKNLYEGKIVRR